jgi:UPF0755 protein
MAGYRYRTGKRRHRLPWRVWLVLVVLITLAVGGMITARNVYTKDLLPVSSNQSTEIFIVQSGNSVRQIADDLERLHLIRSSWAFQLYAQRQQLSAQLQAGTYALSPSQGTAAIINTLTHGKVTTKLVTIVPGRRIDQVRTNLINDGFTPAAVDRALDPANYSDLPALAFKPAAVTNLEGLLWPDSYQKQPNTDPSVIIRESLVAMGTHLTSDVQAGFAAEGLTTYQGLTLASIINQEISKPTDQVQAAQVFLSRLKAGMVLGSDAATRYGSIEAGHLPSLTYDSPYNTTLHVGLPPTPISTISSNALNAALHPASTNWLYFVTGDDGTTYFSTNLQDHQALTQQYCHKLCSAE